MLKLTIILFVLDVAMRRIQIDRAEWLKATQNLRRYLFFWKGETRPKESDESMAALLARRAQVRTTTTSSAEPRPELFQPVSAPTTPLPGQTEDPKSAPASKFGGSGADPSSAGGEKKSPSPDENSTASRLLQAKRKAQKDRFRPK